MKIDIIMEEVDQPAQQLQILEIWPSPLELNLDFFSLAIVKKIKSLVSVHQQNKSNLAANSIVQTEYEWNRGSNILTRTISISAIGMFLKCFTYMPRSALDFELARLHRILCQP